MKTGLTFGTRYIYLTRILDYLFRGPKVLLELSLCINHALVMHMCNKACDFRVLLPRNICATICLSLDLKVWEDETNTIGNFVVHSRMTMVIFGPLPYHSRLYKLI